MTLVIHSIVPDCKRSSMSSSPTRMKQWGSIPSVIGVVLVILVVICDISSPTPLPSSSAWSLPTLNYLFKDTKTRSQSLQYQKEQNGNGQQQASTHQYKTGEEAVSGGGDVEKKKDGKVSSTGRLISVHDIRLTDNWGWVRRGASDPSQTTEQRRKQSRNNIRHSKSKHKQRYPNDSSSSGMAKKKKDAGENLLCPFDEIRGPDGKCRKAPRFSLYRVG